jgi:SAM-dependent methyltransferase
VHTLTVPHGTLTDVDEWWRSFFDATYRRLWADRTDGARTAADVDGIAAVLAAHGAPAAARLVDVPCGDGRIAVGLAERGHAVTGIDLSASMIDAARERAAAARVDVQFVEGDMRLVHTVAGRNQVAVSWFSSFGYFDDSADDLAALESVRRALDPGGLFLLETQHRDRMAALHAGSGPQRDWHDADGTLALTERWFDPLTGRAGERLVIAGPDGRREQREFSVRSYTVTELVNLLRAADLHVEAVYGGPGPTPFGLQTRALIVARRGVTT